jgi:hypothetical protein
MRIHEQRPIGVILWSGSDVGRGVVTRRLFH